MFTSHTPPEGPNPPPGTSVTSPFARKAALVAAPGTIAFALLYGPSAAVPRERQLLGRRTGRALDGRR
ncbi:hypothetical protein [Streptomyces sp. NBC_01538]|uniref:hypothetical protein n=1 Tax=Streptomyces sp. NBC_01538 TaxID=2903897 RepID=UPI003863510F